MNIEISLFGMVWDLGVNLHVDNGREHPRALCNPDKDVDVWISSSVLSLCRCVCIFRKRLLEKENVPSDVSS